MATKLPAAIFDQPFNEALIHQVVTAYMAGGRSGNSAQKSRSDVRGGGKKPWRQKGTGRARAGTRSSPIWRSGGVTFASKKRDYSQKVNRKMYRGAIRSILSELARLDRIIVVKKFELAEPKTKLLAAELVKQKCDKVMIVLDAPNANVALAARNLPYVFVTESADIDPVSLVNFDKVLFTDAAVKQLEERLS